MSSNSAQQCESTSTVRGRRTVAARPQLQPVRRRLALVDAANQPLAIAQAALQSVGDNAAVGHAETQPYLVPVMSARQAWTFRGLVAVWLVALGSFWQWWLQAEHVVSVVGLVLNSVLLLWTTCLPAWCFFFVHRARRPNRALELPPGRVAMIVTKTSSEPWSVVQQALQAMLDQQLTTPLEFWLAAGGRTSGAPRRVDIWLADEDPAEDTRDWCGEHGVQISSRKGVPEYHNASWPAKTRCKEGNLRYFYEALGSYEQYDFVVQLDSDQVPQPGYLIEMLRPFADSRVGYVAAPSIGDANAHRSWTARARASAEAVLHGVWQAGYNRGYPPMCFGSHYAVRTRALREVGGLGPELAEDHSTTLLLNAAGWRGAFALDAVAHGDGPSTVADAVTQELQWSRSVTMLLLTLLPRTWRSLNVRERLVFCLTELWYPLFGLHMLASYLLPIAALLTRSPLVAVDLVEFTFRSCVLGVCALAPLLWVRRQGWLRPVDARILSWETGLYQFVRWPWVLLGFAQAILGWRMGRTFDWRVTPKGADHARVLPLSVVLLPALLALTQVLVALLVDAPGLALGYYAFALVNAFVYTLVTVAIVVLHLRETRCQRGGRLVATRGTLLRAAPAVAAASLALAAALGVRGQAALVDLQPTLTTVIGLQRALADSRDGDLGSRARTALELAGLPLAPFGSLALESGWPASPSRTGSSPLALDLPVDRLAIGAYDPRLDLQAEQLDIEHWFLSQDDTGRLAAALDHSRDRRTLLVTVEPYPARGGGPLLESTIDGAADAQVRRLAQLVHAATPQVVLVRWGHEMDLSGLYPWASNRPDLYRAAFRHVVALFRAERAANARFVWSPAGHAGAEQFYPGDDVVDYIGLTVLSDETWDRRAGLPGQSFADALGPGYQRVVAFGKPIIVAELGVSGTPEHQAAWLAEGAQSLTSFPELRALVYFEDLNPPTDHLDVLPDWRLRPDLVHALLADGGAQR